MYNVYIYILVMAGVTYLIRMVPMVLLRKQIKNRFIKSFLHYVPYVALSAMTFPAILYSTGSIYSALAGFFVASFLAFREKSLTLVAVGACVAVFLVEFLV